MKEYKHKKALIPFSSKEEKTFFKNAKVIGANKSIVDASGKEYQIFFQNDLEYVSDIRVNNPNIGIIVGKVFMKIATFEQYRDKGARIDEKFLSIDAKKEVLNMYKGQNKLKVYDFKANEIMKMLDKGQVVALFNGAYEAIKDSIGQYLIKCNMNDNYIGLTHRDNKTLNYPSKDFYTYMPIEKVIA